MLSRGWLKVGHVQRGHFYFMLLQSRYTREEITKFFYFICFSIVQTDESIVPILALDKASQAGKELNR